MREKEELLLALRETSRQLRFLAFDEQRWEHSKKSSKYQIDIWKTRSPCGLGHVFKGECLVDGTPERVYDMLYPSTDYYKPLWDPHVSKCEILQELSHNALLLHFYMKPVLLGLISARDSIEVCLLESNAAFKSVELGSVTHDDHPPTVAGYVRGWSYPTGAFVFPTDDAEQCRVVVVFHADPNTQHIPKSVFEAATPTMMIQFLTALKKTHLLPWTPLFDVPGRRCEQMDDDSQRRFALRKKP